MFRESERKQEQKRETRGSSFIFSLYAGKRWWDWGQKGVGWSCHISVAGVTMCQGGVGMETAPAFARGKLDGGSKVGKGAIEGMQRWLYWWPHG